MCKPNYGCYSHESPETHAQFMDVQSYLNRFASGVRFALLQVDGVIGSATSSAAEKVTATLSQTGVSAELKHAAVQLRTLTGTYEDVARHSNEFLAFLRRASDEIGLPPVAPPPKPAAPVQPSPSPVPAPPPFVAPPSATSHRRRTYFLAGLGALAAGLTLAGIFYATRRKQPQPVAGLEVTGKPPWWRDWQPVPGSSDYRTDDGWHATIRDDSHGRKSFDVRNPRGKLVSQGGIVDTRGRHIS